MPEGPLPLRAVRNQDFREVSLEVEGRPVLRFAAVYGFRNIQTLMRKIKSGRCEYHYAEVMACPSGEEAAPICVNLCAPLNYTPCPRISRIRWQYCKATEACVHRWKSPGGQGVACSAAISSMVDITQ